MSGAETRFVLSAINLAPRVGKWLVRTVEDQRELARLIRSSLERAICPGDPDQVSVQTLVNTIVTYRLHAVPIPTPTSRLRRIGRRVAHTVTLGRLRPLPGDLPPGGEDFFGLIGEWVKTAFAGDWPEEELAAVNCMGERPDVETVMLQFRDALEQSIYSDGKSTGFYERARKLQRNYLTATSLSETERRKTELKTFLNSLLVGGVTAVSVDLASPDTA
jgi:hypothetical protein